MREVFATQKELAEYLGVSIRTVQRYVEEIPHARFGSKRIYPKAIIDEWLKKRADEEEAKSCY